MSYLVLARKWRPRSFGELVGQEHVVRALANALDSGRVHHAFLFTGTRGVGKTTVARILAKALNCETGAGANPCGACSACREIDSGRFVDLIEVDAASRTKVEDTRELLENVQYAPSRGRYKVYLVDEVHMLSGHSFNALLKTLEEPPPHVKFLLATTDPQKLPITVLSRCLQFHLKRLTPGLIAERLRTILEAEQVGYDPGALPLLARAADGSLRDALSLLDQALVFGAGRAGEPEVRAMLGTIDRGHVARVAELLAAGDGPGLVATAAALDEQAPDYDQVLAELAALLQRVALEQVVPGVTSDGGWDAALLQRLAAGLPAADVQLCYQMALHGRRDLGLAPEPRVGFEMTLLRMLAFRPASAEQQPVGGEARGETDTAAPRRAAARGAGRPPLDAAPAGRAAAPAREPGSDRADAAARGAAVPPPAAGAAPTPTQAPLAAPADAAVVPLDAPAAAAAEPAGEAEWQATVARLGLAGLGQQLAANCAWLGRDGDVVRLRLDRGLGHVRTPNSEERLAQALSRHYGAPVRVVIEMQDAAGEADTPARRAARDAEARLAAARESLANDPTVRALQDRFGATLQPDTVKPLR